MRVTFYSSQIKALSIIDVFFFLFNEHFREECTCGIWSSMLLYVIFQQEENKSKCSLSSIPLIFGKNNGLSINEEITF
jgi:hypothetical protein